MSAATVSIEPRYKNLRCPECWTKGDFPTNVNLEDVTYGCEVCCIHRRHDLIYDFTCSFCIATLWRARLRAFRIFLFQLLYHGASE